MSDTTAQSPEVAEPDDLGCSHGSPARLATDRRRLRVHRLAASRRSLEAAREPHFIAHQLGCMGYHARVTQKSADGGVDVIAHRDELGFERPVIKVQCKQTVATIGRPDVQRLLGAVERDEFGLFVTLGDFSREARDTECSKPQLRLVNGQDLCDLVFSHYERFDPQWQAVAPLKRRYIPGLVT